MDFSADTISISPTHSPRPSHTLSQQVTVLDVLTKWSQVPRFLCYSLVGSQWHFLRRSLNLVPLRFRDPNLEFEYAKDCLDRHKVQFPFISLCTFVSLLAVWILYGIGCAVHWIVLHYYIVSLTFHLLTAFLVIMQIALTFVPFIERVAPWTEEIWYTTQTLTLTTICFWLSWTIQYADNHTPIDEDHPMNYRYWLELRLLGDLLSTGLYAFFLLQADCLLDSTTRKSIWFHVAAWVVYALSRLWQAITFNNPRLTTLNFMDAFLTFIMGLTVFVFRWFQEANHRARFLMTRESKMSVQRIKQARGLITRRATTSAAEEILNLLNNVKDRIADRVAATASSEPLAMLQVAERELNVCRGRLASGASGDVMKRRSQDQSGDDDKQFDQFVDLYRNEGTAAVAKRSAASKRRRQTIVARPGHVGNLRVLETVSTSDNDEPHTILINEVEVPLPVLTDVVDGKIGRDFSYRILDFSSRTKHIVTEVGSYLLSDFLEYIEAPEPVMLGFLFALELTHWASNPFNNTIHAAHVAHSFVCLTRMVDLDDQLSELERFALTVAAIGHAAGHSGRNSNFYIASNHVLAWAQNDVSVLEHSNCFVLNLLLKSCVEVNLVANLSYQEQQQVRKLMTDAIMSLDMAKHFEILSKWRVRRASPEYSLLEEQDRQLATHIVMKTAEHAYTMIDWSQHLDWSFRLCEENYQQGDHEKALGLNISPLCDRDQHGTWPASVISFLQYLIIPMLDDLSLLSPLPETVGVEITTRILLNRERWEILNSKNKTESLPPEICELLIGPPHWGSFQTYRAIWATDLKSLTTPISKEALRKIGAKT